MRIPHSLFLSVLAPISCLAVSCAPVGSVNDKYATSRHGDTGIDYPPQQLPQQMDDYAQYLFRNSKGNNVLTFEFDDREVGLDGKKHWGIGKQVLRVRVNNPQATQGTLDYVTILDERYEYDLRCAVQMQSTQGRWVTLNHGRTSNLLKRANSQQMILCVYQSGGQQCYGATYPQSATHPILLESVLSRQEWKGLTGYTGTQLLPDVSGECTNAIKSYNDMLRGRALMDQYRY